MTSIDPDLLFKKYFPNLACQFSLKPIQKRVVANVLSGNNSLCIMQTGGGKSLTYWLSGMIFGGVTIVVTPLIALIDEQAKKLQEQGCDVLTFHTGLTMKSQMDSLIDFAKGIINPNFIFVSPERLATDGFFEYCINQRKNDIKLFVIDEVHCVSQWGFSFRPFYKHIPDFLNNLYGDCWNPKILALTATLNPKEVIDICKEFRIDKTSIIKDDLLMRNEITLKVIKLDNEEAKEKKLWDLLEIHKGEKALIYLYRKSGDRSVENFSDSANKKGYKSTFFHGDLSAKERQNIISAYNNDDINIIFATNAFGMGIDISDIRVVIHYMIPESVEQYYQEIGRSARDGLPANAYLLFSEKNIDVKKTYFIERSFPSEDTLNSTYTSITQNEIGLKTTKYFDNEDIQRCLSYYLEFNQIKIIGKSISSLKCFDEISNTDLKALYDSTKSHGTITTLKTANISSKQYSDLVFFALLNGQAKVVRSLDKCLIIKVESDYLNSILPAMMTSIQTKKDYKNNLLDYFVYLLNNCSTSQELHQEIGRYLGVPKDKLNLIYTTEKGDLVRSKSEVIIANLLFSHSVKYLYEKELYYCNEKYIRPDFTIITSKGKTFYWEHLGMLGNEEYDCTWLFKKRIYDEKFPNQLIVSYEGATLVDSALKIITSNLLE